MFRVLFALLSICFYSNVVAQDYIDLVKLHYVNTPENNFDTTDASTNVRELSADITLPIKMTSQTTVITGLKADHLKVQLSPFSLTSSLYSYALKVGVNHKHSDKWSGSFLIIPKISSDLKKLSIRDVQLARLLLVKYQKTENLNFNFGVYCNSELFGIFIVPLFGFYYRTPNKKLEINATLPVWADINYQLNPWFKIGSNFSSSVTSYNISENDTYAVKKNNEIFGYFQFDIQKKFLFQTKIGYSIDRSYKAYDNDDKVNFGLSAFRFGDNREVLNSTFQDGFIFKLRFLYRFQIK